MRLSFLVTELRKKYTFKDSRRMYEKKGWSRHEDFILVEGSVNPDHSETEDRKMKIGSKPKEGSKKY